MSVSLQSAVVVYCKAADLSATLNISDIILLLELQ